MRAKITPTIRDDGVHVLLEWVNVEEGERPGEVVDREEFFVGVNKQGTAYFSKVAVHEHGVLGGTFFLDPDGKRHFVALIDAALLGLTGTEM